MQSSGWSGGVPIKRSIGSRHTPDPRAWPRLIYCALGAEAPERTIECHSAQYGVAPS